MPLLERQLVLGRFSILFAEELGGDVLPQLAAFFGELLLKWTHHFRDGLQFFEIDQRVELFHRRHGYARARCITSPPDVVSPTAIEKGNDARLGNMLDLGPFLVLRRVLVVRVDNTLDEEMSSPKP